MGVGHFHVGFEHGGRQDVAGVIEGAPVGERVVGVGDGKIIAVRSAAEIDHAATVIADFEEQAGELFAQLSLNLNNRRGWRGSSTSVELGPSTQRKPSSLKYFA